MAEDSNEAFANRTSALNNANSTTNTSNCDLYTTFEQDMNLNVPSYLKKILIINGYDNENTISRITENDIAEIENFAKTNLPNIIQEQEHEQYFWIFHQNVQNFKIVGGHRKLVLLMAEYFMNKSKADKTLAIKEEIQLEIAETIASSPSILSLNDDNSSNNSTFDQNSSYDLNEETKHILKSLKSWMKRKCNDKQWNFYEDKYEQLQFSLKSNVNGTLECIITCFCKVNHLIIKEAKKDCCQPKWVFSNFHKHFKVHHLNSKDEQQEQNKLVSKEVKYFPNAQSPTNSLTKSKDQFSKISVVSEAKLIEKPVRENNRVAMQQKGQNKTKQAMAKQKPRSNKATSSSTKNKARANSATKRPKNKPNQKRARSSKKTTNKNVSQQQKLITNFFIL